MTPNPGEQTGNRPSRVSERAVSAFAVETPDEGRAPPLPIAAADVAALAAAARDGAPVSGLSHAHYRYPARFSPKLARACIETFTRRGDLVCDPFLGGGTTAVEAAAAARDFTGCDISTLAAFLSETKSRAFDGPTLGALTAWAARAVEAINMHGDAPPPGPLAEAGYLRNMSGARLWRLRKALEQVVRTFDDLPDDVAALARCATLKAAQAAIEHRRAYPGVGEFRSMLLDATDAVRRGADDFSAALDAATVALGRPPEVRCLHRSAVGLETDAATRAPRLIVTSPPYPGVHVLYHRWQVDGRKESPLPFWIANRLDGSGESYYTLGHRKNPELRSYFSTLEAALRSMAAISDPDTVLVQVVAFADPAWQLPRYLEANEAAGWSEALLPGIDAPDGRLWRHVPNRRWYADLKGATTGAFEVVLFHRKSA